MSEAGRIEAHFSDGIATLRLCNPRRRNALSLAMWKEIAAFAAGIGARGDVRAVLVRGDGDKVFSAGADISDFDTSRNSPADARAYDNLVEESCQAFEAIPQPTVALVIGACAGAGASLAASCDLRIAADDAFFMVPAARLGLGYDPRGIARFLRVFGPGATRQLLYTADRLAAPRTHALGAVHLLASAADVETVAAGLLQQIALNAPLTIRAAKAAIRAIGTDESALRADAERLYAAADASADYAEGRRAFRERRAPRFAGR
jgi:enoyl-CoA hydratase/carnithine racemase